MGPLLRKQTNKHYIARLTRIGRLFNQSESAKIDKTTDSHDMLAQTDTRYCKTNNYRSHSNSAFTQINTDNTNCTILVPVKMKNDNNYNNRQNPRINRKLTLRYHWGAGDGTMNIIKKTR